MNRREFILTSAMATTASMIPFGPLHAAEKTSRGVHWPIGCFNRPWSEKKDKDWGLDAAFDGIKAAGYKIVGLLRGDAKDHLTTAAATPEYLSGLKKRIADRGLKVNMSALRTKNELSVEEQIKDMRQQIENARFLGAEFGLTFGVDSPKLFQNYYQVMHEVAGFAQEKGLKVVLKPHGGASGAAEEIVRCMKEVNHPNFKIWFDAGNIIYYTGKDPVEQLKPIVEHVTGFCAKDCDKKGGSVLLEFGTGKVNFRAVFTEMKKAGFKGPIMVECTAPSDTAEMATENARKNREYLEKLFASL
jgi:sugar phosphate isomerase/epimerase